MCSFNQRNTPPSFEFESHAHTQSLLLHVELRGWGGPTWITVSVHVCGTGSQKTGETEREDKVKKEKVGRCTCTKQHARISLTRSRKGPEVREGSRPKVWARGGSLGRRPRGQGRDPTLLWCCGRPTKATVWRSSSSWRSFWTSTQCRCTIQSGAGQACSTGNLKDSPRRLYSSVPRLTFTGQSVAMVTLIALLLWIAVVSHVCGWGICCSG